MVSMLSRLRNLLLLLAAVALLVSALPACGGGKKGPAKARGAKAKKAKKAKSQHTAEEIDNWSHLEPFFTRFSETATIGFKDPFQPQFVKFIGKEEVLQQVRGTVGTTTGPRDTTTGPEIPKGPLQRFSLSSYRVLLIQTGTAEPKALLESSNGMAFAVTRDTYVGNEGAYVHDITQYYVVFRMPGEPEPVIKSLKPELLEQLAHGMDEYLSITPMTGAGGR
jgi:Tfp pilus assembly protein PilP